MNVNQMSLIEKQIPVKCYNVVTHRKVGMMNGSLQFLTARKILPLLDLLAKFK